MSRTVCKIFAAALALAVLLCGMSGCGQSLAGGSGLTGSREQRIIDKGILLINNTVIEQKSLVQNDDYDDYCVEIGGLADKTVQDKINSRITEVYDSMQSGEYVPPYRGMAVKLKMCEGYSSRRYVSVSEQYNSFNMLSLLADCFVNYDKYDEQDGYLSFVYGYSVPLNFDLTTGEELSLEDVFERGADYLALLSDAADTELMASGYDSGNEDEMYYYGDETMLTAPFKGIKQGQKFYISADGSIVLLLDYDTPEFYVNYMPQTMVLGNDELDGKLRMYRRPDSPVFENTDEIFSFTSGRSDTDRFNTVSDYKEEQPRPNLYTTYGFECPARFADAVIEKIKDIAISESSRPEDTDAIYDDLKSRHPQEEIGVSASSYTSVISTSYEDYISIERMDYISSWYTDIYGEYQSEGNTVYSTRFLLDPVTGEEKPYSVLFAQPDKAEDIIEEVMVKKLTAIPGTDAEKARIFAREIITHINGANVTADTLVLSFDLSDIAKRQIIDETFGWPEDFYSCETAVSSLDYSEIGCSNLAFFKGL